MNDILQYNKYINLFENLYVYTKDAKAKDLYDLIEEPKGLFSKKIKPHNIEDAKTEYIISQLNQKLDAFIDEECKFEDMLSFSSLWQFCQFVRYAEKVVFYKNEIENSFYVDSDMFDIKERAFQIKYRRRKDDIDIQFRLEKTTDEINKQEFKVITLNIKRNYGKKMMNVFTIVNEDVKLNDSSDLYLIDNINHVLYDNMIYVLKDIIVYMRCSLGIYAYKAVP